MAALKPLVSIAIPTWNRRKVLGGTLAALAQLLVSLSDRFAIAKQVEVIISDNASEDGTGALVAPLVATFPCPLRYHRNPVNLGVSRNLLNLLQLAAGDYFLFIGDDDLIEVDGLALILRLASSGRPPVAIIQDLASPVPLRMVGFSGACRLFYEYGNAYMGCVRTAPARQAVARFTLEQRVAHLVWPQTAFGFLGMHIAQGSDRGIAVVQRSLGSSPHHQALNIKRFSYFTRSFFDLVEVAGVVGECAATRRPIASLLSPRSPFLHAHLRGMCRMALIEDIDRPALLGRLVKMRHHTGGTATWVDLAIRLATWRPVAWCVGVLVRSLASRTTPWRAAAHLRTVRDEHRSMLGQSAKQDGVRTENYFDPS